MQDDLDYVLSLQAVRERANQVYDLAVQGRLNHFKYDSKRLDYAAGFVADIITREFGPDRYHKIPPHGRWQHFNVGGFDRVSAFLEETKGDDKERARVLIDLFIVSVLLDAGTGGRWYFHESDPSGFYERSEGIAVASLHMFKAGAFSSTREAKVDGAALQRLTAESFSTHFQVSPENQLLGVEARVQVLRDTGRSLVSLTEVFGKDGRPGNLVDYLLASATEPGTLDYAQLWKVLQQLLLPAWPKSRPHLNGHPIGDAWPLEALKVAGSVAESSQPSYAIQPFHKLTQWLAYSLTVPFMRILGLEWKNIELGTGLPEYRNGGLFVDLEVLKLNDRALNEGQAASAQDLPMFDCTSDVIVEWRAMTVALLDRLHGLVTARFADRGVSISMAQMLEAGTWKAGRELAKKYRPKTSSSPILLDGDGTLF